MPEENLLFSVVVPFRDEERYIEGCIRALREQDLDRGRYELIFIDNGSTDRSAEIVRQYDDITLLQEARPDPYLARNRGIDMARGEYIAFTDADCLAEPDWLTRIGAEIEATAAAIVVGRLTFPPNSSTALACYARYYDAKCELIFTHGPKECYYGHAGNMAVRRSLFEALGTFVAMPVAGDTEFIHRCLDRLTSPLVAYLPDAVVTHVEVSRWGQCLKKVFRYGTYSQVLTQRGLYRPLNFREKLAAFKRYRDASDLGLRESIPLTYALGTGWACFQAGRLWVRLGG